MKSRKHFVVFLGLVLAPAAAISKMAAPAKKVEKKAPVGPKKIDPKQKAIQDEIARLQTEANQKYEALVRAIRGMDFEAANKLIDENVLATEAEYNFTDILFECLVAYKREKAKGGHEAFSLIQRIVSNPAVMSSPHHANAYLGAAAAQGDAESLAALIDAGATIDPTALDYKSVLGRISGADVDAKLVMLLKAAKDPRGFVEASNSGGRLLSYFFSQGHTKAAELLINSKFAALPATSPDKETLLFYASDVASVDFMIDHGIDPNHQALGVTALEKLVIQANVRNRNRFGAPAILALIERGNWTNPKSNQDLITRVKGFLLSPAKTVIDKNHTLDLISEVVNEIANRRSWFESWAGTGPEAFQNFAHASTKLHGTYKFQNVESLFLELGLMAASLRRSVAPGELEAQNYSRLMADLQNVALNLIMNLAPNVQFAPGMSNEYESLKRRRLDLIMVAMQVLVENLFLAAEQADVPIEIQQEQVNYFYLLSQRRAAVDSEQMTFDKYYLRGIERRLLATSPNFKMISEQLSELDPADRENYLMDSFGALLEKF